jgi:hypothetical protein
MKKLTFKEIAVMFLISYLFAAYIQGDLNPMNWPLGVRSIQLLILTFALFAKLGLKNTF